MKAKEFIPASKPRNFVAKNQKTAGAGAHKDKKRAEKQGDVKHKQKQFEQGVAEGSYTTEKQLLTRIRQIMYDRKLSGTDSNAGELNRLKQQLKDMRSQLGVEEGWKDKVAAAGLAGAMAFGAGGAHARVAGDQDSGINRLTGKPIATQQATDNAKAEAPKGFSKEYLQAVVDGKHPRPMISKEKAQELLKNMSEGRHGYDDAGFSLAPGHDEGEPVYNPRYDRTGSYDRKAKSSQDYNYNTGKPLGNEPKKTGYVFYNVADPQTAQKLGLKQTKSGKWYLPADDLRQDTANKVFGKGRYWEPK
jgi:hypothetical protein